MGDGIWIVGRRRGSERQGHRNRLAVLDQTGGGDALFVSDEIQRATLVVLAPSTPMAELIEQALYFGRS